jgi:hypothetical protein
MESAGQLYVGAFGSNRTSVAVKLFSYLIQFLEKLYKFCTCSAICKDSGAIYCVTVQHKKKINFRQL